MKNRTLAEKLQQDTDKLQGFSNELMVIARKELAKKSMNNNEYSKLIDLITCMNLKSEEMKLEIDSYLHVSRRRKLQTYIDISI